MQGAGKTSMMDRLVCHRSHCITSRKGVRSWGRQAACSHLARTGVVVAAVSSCTPSRIHAWFWAANDSTPKLSRQQPSTRLRPRARTGVRVQAADSLHIGQLVEFKKDDKAVLGVVSQPNGKKNWFVVDVNGRRFSTTPKSVTFSLPGQYVEQDLASFQEAAALAAKNLDADTMEAAWELADGQETKLEALADLVLMDSSPRAIYSMHRLLQEDTMYFKQSKKSDVLYEPKPAEAVQVAKRELQQQREAEEKARQAAEDRNSWKRFVLEAMDKPHGSKLTRRQLLDSPFAARIRAISKFVLQGDGEGEPTGKLARESLEIAKGAEGTNVLGGWGLLVGLGYWRPHEPVVLKRAGLRAEFPADLELLAQALASNPPVDLEEGARMDLTHLNSYTIDDPSTTEVDDAVSVEQLPGGAPPRLWVHVADPTRYVRMGSELAREAQKRFTTLYLPTGKLPMFPLTLAEGPFSLNEGCVCNTLSFAATLNEDGSMDTESLLITPARIRVTHKLSYEQVDALLTSGEEPDLTAAMAAAESWLAWRLSQGAVAIDLPEMKIEVDPSQLDVVRPALTTKSVFKTPSRILIEEFMVLAGQVAGYIGVQRELPLPYRGQKQPTLPSPGELDSMPHPYCTAFALRCCMSRPDTKALGPHRHAALGIDQYVQVSSPIRRYGDMLAHWQLKASLRGDTPPLSVQEMRQILTTTGETQSWLKGVESEVEGYWKAEYCRQAAIAGRTYKGLLLGWNQSRQESLANVLLDDLGYIVMVGMVEGGLAQPGDRLLVRPERLTLSDVRAGYHSRFELISILDQEPEAGDDEPIWQDDATEDLADEDQGELGRYSESEAPHSRRSHAHDEEGDLAQPAEPRSHRLDDKEHDAETEALVVSTAA